MLRELTAQVDDLVESDEETIDNAKVGVGSNAINRRLRRPINSNAATIHEYSDPSVVEAQLNRSSVPIGLHPCFSTNSDPLASYRVRTQSDCLHPSLTIADPAIVGAVAAPAAFSTSYSQAITISSVPSVYANETSTNLEDPAIISAVSSRVPADQVTA